MKIMRFLHFFILFLGICGQSIAQNDFDVESPSEQDIFLYESPKKGEVVALIPNGETLTSLEAVKNAENYDVPRLSIAVSKDLFHWEKKGPAFATAYNGKFLNMASKSGSMITGMKNGRPVLAKINGKYWMYWGEHFVNLAWSVNLSDWNPLLDESGALKKTMITRPGKFDSDLTECGPPALITDKGIPFFYTSALNEGLYYYIII